MTSKRINARTPKQVINGINRGAEVFVPTSSGWLPVAYLRKNGRGVAVIYCFKHEIRGGPNEPTIKPGEHLINFDWENLDDEIFTAPTEAPPAITNRIQEA